MDIGEEISKDKKQRRWKVTTTLEESKIPMSIMNILKSCSENFPVRENENTEITLTQYIRTPPKKEKGRHSKKEITIFQIKGTTEVTWTNTNKQEQKIKRQQGEVHKHHYNWMPTVYQESNMNNEPGLILTVTHTIPNQENENAPTG